MLKFPSCLFLFVGLLVLALRAADDPVPAPPKNPLVWDEMKLSVEAKPADKEAKFEFKVTNTSDAPVEITQIQPSCGCTVAEMPSTPWILAPGAKGSFTAVVDFQGKHGKVAKTLHVHSVAGSQMLTVVIDIPETEEERRERNQQMAFIDRQAVFRGDCASCHVMPTIGRIGGELFEKACGICHTANPRASMVPDLTIARQPRNAEFWRTWISEGKDRTLMPAFSSKHGGPLTEEQVASLVEYALKEFPTEPGRK